LKDRLSRGTKGKKFGSPKKPVLPRKGSISAESKYDMNLNPKRFDAFGDCRRTGIFENSEHENGYRRVTLELTCKLFLWLFKGTKKQEMRHMMSLSGVMSWCKM
jgi:hypothetical protein